MPATQITVYVQALPGDPNFGDTSITIPENDPDRAEFLETCEEFFIGKDRKQDADKFYQAVKQTPSTP